MAALDLSERFRRRVTLIVDSHLASADVHRAVAVAARATLATVIGSGLASPIYRRFVDGFPDVIEEAVRLDGGTIVYRFSHLSQAAAFALAYAINRSPERSGDYRRGWFFLVDGAPWMESLESIPKGAEVVLTNAEPYHRKIDVGGQVTSVPPGIVEDTRQAVKRAFPGLVVERRFVHIPNNYILKGRAKRSGLSFNLKSMSWTRMHSARATRRADSKAGEMLTYPAVVFTEAEI